MGDFDIVEFGYNAADETINFGTRCLAEGDNLYEVSTLATLKCSSPKEKAEPYINAIVCDGLIYFSTDATMRIFKDVQCSDIIFNASFEAIIDSICVSQGGDYVLICLRDGMVHLIDCKDEYNCVSSQTLERDEDGDRFFINTFRCDDYYLLVTKLGHIYKMTFLNDAHQLDCVYEFNFRTQSASFQYPFVLVNGTKLAIFDFEVESGTIVSDGGWEFAKIFPLNYMFLALDAQGNLYHICAITLQIFPVNNTTLYKDMHILSDGNETQVIALVEEEHQKHIQLLSYREWSKLYSIKVSNEIHLISLDSLNDEILYISKILSDDAVSELRFHVVNETVPEQRLKRLLKKHKYDEAEKFLKLFNLDPTLISKAKAQEIVDKTACTPEDITNLLDLLDTIDDDVFRLQCCADVDSSCSNFMDVKKILNYGCKLQLRKQATKAAAGELQTSLTHTMFRFDTFVTIHRGQDQETQAWWQFLGCNLIEEVKTLLTNYKIEEAKIIYSRLGDETAEKLTETHVSDILAILNNISITVSEPFLPVFISVTLPILPSTLPMFVKWTISKVQYLEKRAKSDFPNNAIKFARHIVELMRVGEVDEISFQRQCVLHRESLVELSSLLTTLQMLKTLKDEYMISVPVAGYLSGSENVVRLLLKVQMAPQEYDVFLKRFLCKYMVEHHMEPNEMLLEEIKDLMQYEECMWVNIVEPILNCISSVSVKLQAVRTILDFAAVPWSDGVRKIANDALKHSHAMTAKIRELIENEPVQVVLQKSKYKIKERKICRTVDDLKFVVNRIIYCNEPSMVDDVYKLCKYPEHRHVANMLLIKHFIRQGSLVRAMSVLDDNTAEEIRNCARELAVAIELCVNNEMGLSDELTNNYYEAAGSIFRRLNVGESNEFYRQANERTLGLIRNVHGLRKHFEVKITTYDLRDERKRDEILDGILEDARCRLETGKTTVDGVLAICEKLAIALSLDCNEILLRFCEKSGDYNVIIEVAQRLYESRASCRSLCLMVVLLLRYVGTYKIQLRDDSSLDLDDSLPLTNSGCIVDDTVFCKGLQVAEALVSKALFKAQPDEILQSLEVARWVNTAFYFTKRDNCQLKRQLFGDMYESATVLPGFLTFSTIKNVFLAFCSYTGGLSGSDKNPNAVYLTKFNTTTLTKEGFMQELSNLSPVLENMGKEGQHFTSYRILEALKQSVMQLPSSDTSILKSINDMSKKICIPKVLSAILANSVIDTDLLYNLLLVGDPAHSRKFLVNSWKMYKKHPRKFGCISRTGLKLWGYYKISKGEAEMQNALIVVKWWKKMEGKRFDYDSFFKVKSEERFEFLVNADCLDITLAKEYCVDFGLDLKASYKYFLRKVFINWRPDYEIKTDGSKKYILIRNSEVDLLKKCHEIMDCMDKAEVHTVITNVWSTINAYYYEVFIAMLNVLSRINPQSDNNTKQLSMLMFLKNYQRVSKPSETEVEQWYTKFPDTQPVDVLSEFRLSFTQCLFTQQIFDIIRPELNLQTYKLWFDAIDILQPYLNTDQICSFVVKDVVTSGILSKDAADEWVLHAKHEDLFKEIDECVTNITNLELITSVMYHLVIHTPRGADQVYAAQMCYKYAVQYRKLNPDSSDVEKAVTKVEKKYFTYAAMHILHTHKLTDERYVNLLSQPKELILSLYLDERILRKNELNLHCVQINGAAEALAALFSLDIKKIRFELIQSSLGGENPAASLDFDASMIYTNGDQSDDEALNRIAYVCCADDAEYWRTRLFQLGFGEDPEEQRSVHCKARALKVFVMITDIDDIHVLTGLTYAEFLNFIDKLTIVSNLQYLGIALHNVEALVNYSKKELLNRLVQRGGSMLAIKTMVLICMTYGIYDVKYWEFIVNSTVSMSLFVELRTYVNFLNKVNFRYKAFYINAWQKLIDHSFTNLPYSEHVDQVLLTNFLTIQSCPVLNSLNLDNAFRRCMDRDKAEFAAVLLQYLDGNRRDEYVKEIRNSNKDLVASLNNLGQNGLWGIPYVKSILKET